jgi:hypothetical protein
LGRELFTLVHLHAVLYAQRYEIIFIHCFTFTQKSFYVTKTETSKYLHYLTQAPTVLYNTQSGHACTSTIYHAMQYRRRVQTVQWYTPLLTACISSVIQMFLRNSLIRIYKNTLPIKNATQNFTALQPQISINVPSSCPTIILQIIILKPSHYDVTGIKIPDFILSKVRECLLSVDAEYFVFKFSI